MKSNSRNTKIIWSFESQSLNSGAIAEINAEQVDALRLLYDEDEHEKLKKFVAELKNQNINVPLMVDIAAKVRATVSDVHETRELEFGESITLTPPNGGGDIAIKTDDWSGFFKKDAMIFFGYGNVLLQAESISEKQVKAKVIQGGIIQPDLEVHIPVTRKLKKFADSYIKELCSNFDNEIDFLVIPAFTTVEGIKELKEAVCKYTKFPPWFLLKVNSEDVYTKIDNLMDEVDGIFLSRLDMALTVDPAMIPVISKELIRKANESAKLVVVASEMLGSMRHNATPTRAEVSDVANAVIDGADAVVLSEEVAHGPYAERASEVVNRIVLSAEEQTEPVLNWKKKNPSIVNEMDAVSYGAYCSAQRMGAKAIVCITETGNTAMALSAYRGPYPIVSVTFSKSTRRRLSLIRGVQALLLKDAPSIDDVLPMINDELIRNSWLEVGDKIVFVSVTLSPIGKDSSNLFTIQRLNEKIPRA